MKPTQIILTRIKGPYFFIADMKSAYNQIPLDKPSQRLANFVIIDNNTVLSDCFTLFQSALQPFAPL